MTVAFADQEPDNIEPVDMDDLYVGGQFNSASIYENDLLVTIGGMPDLPLSIERAKDLQEVLDRALEFHHAYFD